MSFLRKSNSSKTSLISRHLDNAGFTLMELLVVIMILSVLVSLVLAILNPVTQIKKSQDTQRQHDLKQLATGLDSYYNDNNYYPQTTVTLITNKNIQAVPRDPTASKSWSNYAYLVDLNNNPQWNVLFAKLAFPTTSSFSCPLEQMQNCLPTNYADLGYNYCIVSGNVKCDQITTDAIIPLPVTVSPNVPTPTSTPTPTQTPFYCWCRNAAYWIDKTKDQSHQCQVVQTSSDPSVNYDRFCTSPCVDPCTQ